MLIILLEILYKKYIYTSRKEFHEEEKDIS